MIQITKESNPAQLRVDGDCIESSLKPTSASKPTLTRLAAREEGVSRCFGSFLSPISGSEQSLRLHKLPQTGLDRNMRVPSQDTLGLTPVRKCMPRFAGARR
jgi:hypothetical protein